MELIRRNLVFGMVIGMAILAPVFATAQTVFTYEPTDSKTILLSAHGTATISVDTLVIIQASPEVKHEAVETRSFTVTFQPPMAGMPKLIQAEVDGQVVDVNILRSDIDGEMEASVQIPVTAGINPILKMDWATSDLGNLEMTLEPKLDNRIQGLHGKIQPMHRTRLSSILLGRSRNTASTNGLCA